MHSTTHRRIGNEILRAPLRDDIFNRPDTKCSQLFGALGPTDNETEWRREKIRGAAVSWKSDGETGEQDKAGTGTG